MAKIASDFEKPNKIHTLFKKDIPTKLWPLRIEDMFLLGAPTAKKLRSIGIDTIGKLAQTDINILTTHLKSHGKELYDFAWGKDIDDKHIKKDIPKSISHSKTSVHDLTDIAEIYNFILDIVNDTCYRLRKENMKTTNISITLKTSNFKIYSSSKGLLHATNVTKEIFEISKNIFNTMYKNEPLRLIGVNLAGLVPDDVTQRSFFDSFDEKEQKVDNAVDSLISKFGNKITKASLIKKKIVIYSKCYTTLSTFAILALVVS